MGKKLTTTDFLSSPYKGTDIDVRSRLLSAFALLLADLDNEHYITKRVLLEALGEFSGGGVDPDQSAITTADAQPITPPSGYSLARVMVEYPDPSVGGRLKRDDSRMSKDYVANELYIDVYDGEILTLTWF